MAALAITLVEFADKGNSRTYVLDGHQGVKPHLLIQKRTVATSPTSSMEDTIDVVYGTTDTEGTIVPGRISLSIRARRPVSGQKADVDAALATLRAVVASDEFARMLETQRWLK